MISLEDQALKKKFELQRSGMMQFAFAKVIEAEAKKLSRKNQQAICGAERRKAERRNRRAERLAEKNRDLERIQCLQNPLQASIEAVGGLAAFVALGPGPFWDQLERVTGMSREELERL